MAKCSYNALMRNNMKNSDVKTYKIEKPKLTLILYILVSMFMVFFSITGTLLTNNGNIIWTESTTAKIVGASIGGGIVIGLAVGYGIYFANLLICKIGGKLKIKEEKIKPIFRSPLLIGIVAAVIILACYLPVFLAYYPGIASYDSSTQANMYFSGQYYEHHPLLHTLFIEWCLRAGYAVWGSYNAGIAIYSIIQLTIFDIIFAFGIALVFKWVSKRNLLWAYIFSAALTLFCGMFEFTRYMAISMTKDSLFSVFLLLQFLLFICLMEDTKKKKTGLYIAYICSLILCGLLRNNATYALILVAMFEGLVAFIKWIKYACIKKKNSLDAQKPIFQTKLTIVTVVAVVVTMIILNAMAKALNAIPGDKREMLSVPIQQMARTAVYHSGRMVVPEDDGTLDERTMAVIDEFFLYDGFPVYTQDISDPVKICTNTYVARYKTKEFMYAYLTMLKNHPSDYINAFVALENGFINVNDYSHAVVNQKKGLYGLGYATTRINDYYSTIGVYKDSKLPRLHEYMEEWANDNRYLDYPLIKYIYMPGAYLYIYLFAFITLLKDKRSVNGRENDKNKLVIPMLFVMLYLASCLLGPTVLMRYVYPFMILCPFMTIFCACINSGDDELCKHNNYSEKDL